MKKIFPKHGICARAQQIINIFIIEQVQWKLMTNFLFKLKKIFLVHFTIFWSKNLFSKNQAAMYNFIRVSSLWQNPEKSHDQIPRKHPGRCLEGRMNLPYFIRSFQLLPGAKSTIAVDLRLKVKDKKRDVGLTKNYYITVSMQKISSIHKLIQQILGSHELNKHSHFWSGPPKNHWNYF